MFNLLLALLIFQDFSFVVLGDRTGGAKDEVFEQIIKEIEILKPDFLITVGDLIEGYTNKKETIESEWNYVLGQMNQTAIPFYLTPGNHDIWDAQSESIYIRHFGKTYYSFDYQRCHFVIIDNSRCDSFAEIPQIQLEWLKRDLKRHKRAPLTFCFLHKPFWHYSNQAEKIHQIFKQGGVDYVFSGHNHHYFSKIWDSIVYIQVGPSGSRYKNYTKEAQGAFQNYLLVKIKNNQAQVIVIKPGNIIPYDIVTEAAIKAIDRIEQELVQISRIKVLENQTIQDTISLTIKNITDFDLNTKIKWTADSTSWQIIPESAICILPSKSSGYYRFNCRLTKPESIFPLPRLSLRCPYGLNREYEIRKFLPIQRVVPSYFAPKPPIIDGQLNDAIWRSQKPLTAFGNLEGLRSEIEQTAVYFAYDENNLYIGAKCDESEVTKLSTKVTSYDGTVYQDDHLNFILQPNLDSSVYYQIFINPLGTVSDRKCWLEETRGVKDQSWNLIVQVKVNQAKDNWTLELAIPFAQFINYSKENWGLNLVRYQHRLNKIGVFQVPFAHDPKTFAFIKFLRSAK
ncbi:MAG: metallophosphoesterase [candidate division WOR-3 bacterium]